MNKPSKKLFLEQIESLRKEIADLEITNRKLKQQADDRAFPRGRTPWQRGVGISSR